MADDVIFQIATNGADRAYRPETKHFYVNGVETSFSDFETSRKRQLTTAHINNALDLYSAASSLMADGEHRSTVCFMLESIRAMNRATGPDLDREKLMRWLGFVQALLWEDGQFSIDDLRSHMRKEGT
jgi:hypothetical protein